MVIGFLNDPGSFQNELDTIKEIVYVVEGVSDLNVNDLEVGDNVFEETSSVPLYKEIEFELTEGGKDQLTEIVFSVLFTIGVFTIIGVINL